MDSEKILDDTEGPSTVTECLAYVLCSTAEKGRMDLEGCRAFMEATHSRWREHLPMASEIVECLGFGGLVIVPVEELEKSVALSAMLEKIREIVPADVKRRGYCIKDVLRVHGVLYGTEGS